MQAELKAEIEKIAAAPQAKENAEKLNETASAQREIAKRLEQVQQTSLSKVKFNEFQNRMITELSKKSLDGEQLAEISHRVAETRKRLDDEISKNSQSFSIAQEQLENRVEDKLSKLQVLTLSEDDQNMKDVAMLIACLLYTSPSPRDATLSRMPSSA